MRLQHLIFFKLDKIKEKVKSSGSVIHSSMPIIVAQNKIKRITHKENWFLDSHGRAYVPSRGVTKVLCVPWHHDVTAEGACALQHPIEQIM